MSTDERNTITNYFPTVENVETPLGVADEVWATSATHIGMSGTFAINRVDYRVRLDLHLRDGQWRRGDTDDWTTRFHALMVSRAWDYPGGKPRPETSSSAREKAGVLVDWLAAFAIGEGADLVREAGALDRERTTAAKREQVAKLQTELAALETELDAETIPA